MRRDKTQIFELRKQGKSYREIQKIYPISRSTLCVWFKDKEWSMHIKRSKMQYQKDNQDEILSKMRLARSLRLEKYYKEVEAESVEEFEIYKDNPLFMAGLMLYSGEGDKANRNNIRLANIDFGIHKVFIEFLVTYMEKDIDRLRFGLLLYPDLDIEHCKSKWSIELKIPIHNFHKPMVIQGRHKTKRLHFGVGSTILSSTSKKKKLLIWVELAKKYLIKAAMV